MDIKSTVAELASLMHCTPLCPGHSGIHGIVAKGKTIQCYCQLSVRQTDDAVILDRDTLLSWDILTRAFGPIPLAIVIEQDEDKAVKRASLSWDEEYSQDDKGNVFMPKTGFVKFNQLKQNAHSSK